MILTRSIHSFRPPASAVALASAALVAAAISPSAHASNTPAPVRSGASINSSTTDPDDTPGRLDIARVSDQAVRIDPRHVVVSYRLRTFASFDTSTLQDGLRDFVLELNRNAAPGSERSVEVLSREGVLVADVVSNATRHVIGEVQASRPSDQSIRLSGPRRLLGARSYFWTSNYHAAGSHDCGNADGVQITCQDSVPQRGWIRWDRLAWPRL